VSGAAPRVEVPAVELERRTARTAVVSLARPEKLNALRPGEVAALRAALRAAEADESCTAIVIVGKGRSFCAGADVEHKARLTPDELAEFIADGRALVDELRRSRLVSIAALHGHVLGGGLELALACDLRVAAPGAVLGFPELRRGHLPGWRGAELLRDALGGAAALHLLLTGELLDASGARQLGVVAELAPEGAAQRAVGLADRIGVHAPALVAAVKRVTTGSADA